MKDFHELSYIRHREHMNSNDPERLPVATAWFKENTVDYWRHMRMLKPLLPLLSAFKNTEWLTIGDGRYGLDSIKLRKLEPSLKVLPTDISPYLLQKSLEQNLIPEYKIENAEHLSFTNESFDVSFCKESYHHFPRPYLALYEMIRVSKKAIVLIEPNDMTIHIPASWHKPGIALFWTARIVINILKQLIGRDLHHSFGGYESTGNYIYTVSERELEKVALGLNLPAIAFLGINDYYEPGVEFEEASEESSVFQKTQYEIQVADKRSRQHLQPPGLLISILFKEAPDEDLRKELKCQGFQVKLLPRNPYIK